MTQQEIMIGIILGFLIFLILILLPFMWAGIVFG